MMVSRKTWVPLSLILLLFIEIGWTFSPQVTFRTALRGNFNFFGSILQQPLDNSRRRDLRLWSSSSKPATSSASTNVIYQKVIRPSTSFPEILFLGYLVEYLETRFQLPDKLPMVYKSLPGDEESRYILAWDSPLSPSSEATRMEVEVVGIYTDDDGDKKNRPKTPSVPNMAMVVVRKSKSSAKIPPMMQNLFADSEKKILKVLDRGLEDFIAGKIKFDDDSPKQVDPKKIPNVKTAYEAIDAELVDQVPQQNSKNTSPEDVVLDTTAILDSDDSESMNDKSTNKKISKEAVEAARATMNVKATSNNTSEKPPVVEDFAVQAAKKAAARRSQKENTDAVTTAKKTTEPEEDSAVAAARRIAASRKTATKKEGIKPSPKTATPKGSTKTAPAPSGLEEGPPLQMEKAFEADDYMGDARAFRTTISRPPKNGAAKNNVKVVDNVQLEGKLPDADGKRASSGSSKEETVGTKPKVPEIKSNRKVNLRVVDPEEDDVTDDPFKLLERMAAKETKLSDESVEKEGKAPSQKDIELDIMKAASEVMSDMADQGRDMTPEELLQDVLKFDVEQSQENAPGSGFVSGAFEKAKDILKEQKQKRDERLRQTAVKEITTEMSGVKPDIIDPNEIRELTPEEELKKMFQAGETLANRQITRVTSQDSEYTGAAKEGTTEEDVEALIRGEKSISSYARSLDVELSELEVRINKSPGEEFDGPRRNPVFDPFSGPEVYNPNVDPEAINFPGALPGTKDVRLPKELDEAVKQAEFAVDVLTKMQAVESKDEIGSNRVQYFVGERELTQDHVDNLRKVVVEAAQIGLIRDPLNFMAERARLQMVLDELWEQPEERFRDVAENFKDLLLSDNLVELVKERLTTMADLDLDALRSDDESLDEKHSRERLLLGQLVVFAQLLLKETRALGAELEAQQLEVVRSICKVAMDPRHQTEEETAMALTDAVRDMRPLLDDAFVAYLKYAVAEEEARLARAGLLDDPEHNQWLFVLQIVQQGVYAEIAKGINRYIEHIWYVLRMETPKERRMLLEKLIDVLPTLDVRPFVQVVDNIVGSLGDGTKGEFDGVTALGEMTNKLLQMHRDVKDLLPPDRIALMSRDADEWAAKQKRRLLESRELSQQRLRAARATEHLQEEVESLGRRGEIERIE
jgi:hypothetical protein